MIVETVPEFKQNTTDIIYIIYNKYADFSSSKNSLVIHTFLQPNQQSKAQQAMI
jgi:hypothetical protein